MIVQKKKRKFCGVRSHSCLFCLDARASKLNAKTNGRTTNTTTSVVNAGAKINDAIKSHNKANEEIKKLKLLNDKIKELKVNSGVTANSNSNVNSNLSNQHATVIKAMAKSLKSGTGFTKY